ncbi:MAG: hydantoinase/oxoprolinase family protein, partial [Proteobacteria bacterium]|nr:hydantoinase/oxoprolinase family protein [Pseudomonadota bacterium]
MAVDIGGTFSDVALEVGGRLTTAKVLTTPDAPELGVMEACADVLRRADLSFGDVDLFIHGTTLATNALIERKGAPTALIATQGHRDTLDLAFEDRFTEYDIFIDKPPPLVPRDLRFTVPERMSARGEVLMPLDEAAVLALAPELRRHEIESIAIGFIHGYANSQHEDRTRELLQAALPDCWISVSSEVCPEIREYERLSTTCANAYVQPLMAGYLGRLD